MLRWSFTSKNSPSGQSKSSGSSIDHPFGGCERLLSQYRCIGAELLRIETAVEESPEECAFAFRTAVAYIPVQVLEAYLEDLLDLDVREPTLFITPAGAARSRKMVAAAALAGVVCCLSIAYFFFDLRAGLAVVFGAGSGLAAVGVVAVRPYRALMRRLRFAQVLSREIARRRGTDSDQRGRTAGLFLSEFLTGTPFRRGGVSHSSYRFRFSAPQHRRRNSRTRANGAA